MNSIRFLERGITAEIERQVAVLDAGGKVEQETLHFDPRSGSLTSLRSKEEAHDYRYFPEPDLVPVAVAQEMIAAARDALPELPAARAQRLQDSLGLSSESARILAYRPDLGDYFERALAYDGDEDAQALANWVTGDLVARLGEEDPAESKVEPQALAALVGLVRSRAVTQGAAKQVLDRLVAQGGDPAAIVDSEGLGAMGDGDEHGSLVAEAIQANADAAEKVRAGNPKAIGAIVGHVMRETKGRADGGEVNRLIREQLGGERT